MKSIVLIALLLSTSLMAEEKKNFIIKKASDKVGVSGYYLGDVIPNELLTKHYTKTDNYNEFSISGHGFRDYSIISIETTPNTNKIYSISLNKKNVVCSKEAKKTADILSSNFKNPYKRSESTDGNWLDYSFDFPDKKVFVSCFYYGYNNKLYFFDDFIFNKAKQEGMENVKKRDDYWNRVRTSKN